LKKTILIPFLLFTFFLQAQTLSEKNKICLAIYQVESCQGKYLYNPTDTASLGHFQMRQCYVDDVNRICGFKKFEYIDRFDFDKSVLMFFIFNNYYHPDWDAKKIALRHCCGNPNSTKQKALDYWNKVSILIKSKNK
jgi:hypothetical protein